MNGKLIFLLGLFGCGLLILSEALTRNKTKEKVKEPRPEDLAREEGFIVAGPGGFGRISLPSDKEEVFNETEAKLLLERIRSKRQVENAESPTQSTTVTTPSSTNGGLTETVTFAPSVTFPMPTESANANYEINDPTPAQPDIPAMNTGIAEITTTTPPSIDEVVAEVTAGTEEGSGEEEGEEEEEPESIEVLDLNELFPETTEKIITFPEEKSEESVVVAGPEGAAKTTVEVGTTSTGVPEASSTSVAVEITTTHQPEVEPTQTAEPEVATTKLVEESTTLATTTVEEVTQTTGKILETTKQTTVEELVETTKPTTTTSKPADLPLTDSVVTKLAAKTEATTLGPIVDEQEQKTTIEFVVTTAEVTTMESKTESIKIETTLTTKKPMDETEGPVTTGGKLEATTTIPEVTTTTSETESTKIETTPTTEAAVATEEKVDLTTTASKATTASEVETTKAPKPPIVTEEKLTTTTSETTTPAVTTATPETELAKIEAIETTTTVAVEKIVVAETTRMAPMVTEEKTESTAMPTTPETTSTAKLPVETAEVETTSSKATTAASEIEPAEAWTVLAEITAEAVVVSEEITDSTTTPTTAPSTTTTTIPVVAETETTVITSKVPSLPEIATTESATKTFPVEITEAATVEPTTTSRLPAEVTEPAKVEEIMEAKTTESVPEPKAESTSALSATEAEVTSATTTSTVEAKITEIPQKTTTTVESSTVTEKQTTAVPESTTLENVTEIVEQTTVPEHTISSSKATSMKAQEPTTTTEVVPSTLKIEEQPTTITVPESTTLENGTKFVEQATTSEYTTSTSTEAQQLTTTTEGAPSTSKIEEQPTTIIVPESTTSTSTFTEVPTTSAYESSRFVEQQETGSTLPEYSVYVAMQHSTKVPEASTTSDNATTTTEAGKPEPTTKIDSVIHSTIQSTTITGDEGSGFEKSFESSKSTPQNDGRDDNRLDDDDRDRTPKIGQQPRTTQKPFTERFQTTTEVSTRPEYVRDGFSPIYPENTADFGDSLILPFVEFNQQSSQTSMPTRDSNDPGIRHEHSVFAPSSKSNENSEEAQSTEIGQLAFSKSSQQLYIRVNNGWKEVKLEGFHSMVEQRPPVTAKTVYEQPPPVYHEPKVIVETQPEIRTLAPPPQVEQKQVKPEIHRPRIHHRDKIIHLIALNRSISGNMRGIRGADLMCYQQARQAGFKTTFRAFISSRVQDLLQIVHREDRDTPVVNIRGEKLFEDWASVFTQTSMPSNVPIYSFTYRDVLQGDEWPDKYIWHGSDEQGLRTDGFYCEDWRSSSGFAHGMASALLRGRPLITDAEKISCRRELIVLCVENMSKFNVNRLLRGKQRKFRY